MLLCRCVLLCTHLWDLVPRFRRHPFLDLGLESVCVCVRVCMCALGRNAFSGRASADWSFRIHLSTLRASKEVPRLLGRRTQLIFNDLFEFFLPRDGSIALILVSKKFVLSSDRGFFGHQARALKK